MNAPYQGLIPAPIVHRRIIASEICLVDICRHKSPPIIRRVALREFNRPLGLDRGSETDRAMTMLAITAGTPIRKKMWRQLCVLLSCPPTIKLMSTDRGLESQ